MKIKNKQLKQIIDLLKFRNDPRVKAIDKELNKINNNNNETKR
jgi:hypothetical protein